jgi:isopropylmalate/homocitrate/citramalate synthase
LTHYFARWRKQSWHTGATKLRIARQLERLVDVIKGRFAASSNGDFSASSIAEVKGLNGVSLARYQRPKTFHARLKH